MSDLRKKVNRKAVETKRTDNLVADVTINDFANTLQIHKRLKKAATNVSSKVKQRVTIKEKASTWDETNESLLADNVEEVNASFTSTRKGRRKSKLLSQNDNTKEEEGINYPLDIWFIISEYIPPESVGKFARICKSSHYVTTTAKFWFHLYKTYYKYVPNLPERLQPQCMMRQYGLRACVIRALYYNYFPLLNYLLYFRRDRPHSLVRRKCTHMWHKEGEKRWCFFFKLKEISIVHNSLLKKNKTYNSEKTEFIEMLEDVAVNPEDGCKMLKVNCLKYCMLPPVIGLVLQTVSINLMSNYRLHRLLLVFGTSIIPSTRTTEVILNEVTDCSIIDWWDPRYPYQKETYQHIDVDFDCGSLMSHMNMDSD